MKDAQQSISALQLCMIIIAVVIGTGIAYLPTTMAETLGPMGWMGVLAGGGIALLGTFLLLKIGTMFPGQMFVDYTQVILGKYFGTAVNLYVAIYALLSAATVTRLFIEMVRFYLFDRTPIEVLLLAILLVVLQFALQSLGVVVRIIQAMVIFSTILTTFFLVTLLINFKLENLLPLTLPTFGKLTQAGRDAFYSFSGIECLLLFLPFVSRREQPIKNYILAAALFPTIVYLLVVVEVTAIYGAKDIARSMYPIISAIKSIEIPGTFIERLENYSLVAWVIIAFDTIAIFYYFSCVNLTRFFRLQDHRPIAVVLLPITFVLSQLSENIDEIKKISDVVGNLAAILIFAIVPIMLGIAHFKRQESGNEKGT